MQRNLIILAAVVVAVGLYIYTRPDAPVLTEVPAAVEGAASDAAPAVEEAEEASEGAAPAAAPPAATEPATTAPGTTPPASNN